MAQVPKQNYLSKSSRNRLKQRARPLPISLVHPMKEHFQSLTLSESYKKKLENTLLTYQKPSLFRYVMSYKKTILTHFAVASLAMIMTLFVVLIRQGSNPDLLTDVVLSDSLNLPADFDLEGNFQNLPNLIQDSLPQTNTFHPIVPVKLAQDFSAHEGRFFLFKGEQGVRISVLPTPHDKSTLPFQASQNLAQDRPSLLYIVKLSEKNRSAFPAEQTLRHISSASGKIKKVFAWQDGVYGYAMVEPPSN